MDFKPIYEQAIPTGIGLCSFCGTHSSKTESMVEGPNSTYICVDCTRFILSIHENYIENKKNKT